MLLKWYDMVRALSTDKASLDAVQSQLTESPSIAVHPFKGTNKVLFSYLGCNVLNVQRVVGNRTQCYMKICKHWIWNF